MGTNTHQYKRTESPGWLSRDRLLEPVTSPGPNPQLTKRPVIAGCCSGLVGAPASSVDILRPTADGRLVGAASVSPPSRGRGGPQPRRGSHRCRLGPSGIPGRLWGSAVGPGEVLRLCPWAPLAVGWTATVARRVGTRCRVCLSRPLVIVFRGGPRFGSSQMYWCGLVPIIHETLPFRFDLRNS
jgi:hypothetical protein